MRTLTLHFSTAIGERDVDVVAAYTPAYPATRLDPPEPADAEILSIDGGAIEFDALPLEDRERIMEEALREGSEASDPLNYEEKDDEL